MSRAIVRSVNVGRVETFEMPDGRELTSAIRKRPAEGPVAVTPRGLAGDESQDPSHGGPNMAVHVFALDAYAWFEERAQRALPVPAFGENLSVEGLTEPDVCVGDVVRIGSALFEVSQPTERCKHIGQRLGLPKMLKWIHESLHSGFYLRVLEPGELEAGAAWEHLERPCPEWSIDRLNRAMFREIGDAAQVELLQSLAPLSDNWKARLRLHHSRRTRGATRDGPQP